MKNTISLLMLCLFINSSISYANKFDVSFFKKSNVLNSRLTERGVEIRYYVFDTKPKTTPTEIIIDKVKYTLYKSKQEAIDAVTYSSLKQDYTVVYVISNKAKSTEIIAITD